MYISIYMDKCKIVRRPTVRSQLAKFQDSQKQGLVLSGGHRPLDRQFHSSWRKELGTLSPSDSESPESTLCRPEDVNLPSEYHQAVGLLSPTDLEECRPQKTTGHEWCDLCGPIVGIVLSIRRHPWEFYRISNAENDKVYLLVGLFDPEFVTWGMAATIEIGDTCSLSMATFLMSQTVRNSGDERPADSVKCGNV